MSTDTLHIDFETASRVDLLARGAYIYANDPSTFIHCIGYAINDEPAKIWAPPHGYAGSRINHYPDIPEEIREIYKEGRPRSIHAHNANFERLISMYVFCNDFDVPMPPIEAFYCTATQARRRALPGALANLGQALKLETQKQLIGTQLISKLCKPWKDGKVNYEEGEFRKDDHLFEQLCDYCRVDVETERLAAKMSPPLTDTEQAEYIRSEMINDHGLKIDTELAEAAATYAEAEMAEIAERLSALTGGAVTAPRQFARVKAYMQPYIDADPILTKAVTRYKTDRQTKETTIKQSLDKISRFNILNTEDHEFHPHVLEVMNLLDEAGQSSTSKFSAMVDRSDPEDGRARGAYVSNGAPQTGRYSSMGIQVHNLLRNTAKEPEKVRRTIMNYEPMDNVMRTLASMLRPAITAGEGSKLVVGDWKNIEARVLPWLAEADHILDIYREVDADPEAPDVYTRTAEMMGMDDRQTGKVAVLSLGYGGGVKALQAMARNYEVHIDEREAERIRDIWRETNRWAPLLWRDAERAALRAMRDPGAYKPVGKFGYIYQPEWAALYCILPSGKTIAYPQPMVDEEKKLSCIKANWKPAAGDPDWPRMDLWGGILSQQATQSTAADILNMGIERMIDYGWPLAGHTHDEMISEVDEVETDACEEHMTWAMTDNPEWTAGLPLACDIYVGERYGK